MISPIPVALSVNFEPTNAGAPAAAPAPESAALLPSPDFVSGDPVAMIAKLFVKNAEQKRQSDDLTAKSAEQAEDAADARRIDAMKDKADKQLIAGVVGGLSQAASGAASLAGGAVAAGGDAARVLAQSDGASKMAEGSGKIGEAVFKNKADAADRDIARAESEAKVAKRAQDALHKEVDAAAQHEGKVMQLLQEIKQAQAQCEHAALLRMA